MSVTPNSATLGVPTQFTISGTDFFEEQYPPATVDFIQGATVIGASSFDSWVDTQIVCWATLTLAGNWDVRVTREDGLAVTFVAAVNVPSVVTISITGVAPGGAVYGVPVSVTIDGLGFGAAPTILFTGASWSFSPDSYTSRTATKIICVMTPINDDNGYLNVTVDDGAGNSASMNQAILTALNIISVRDRILDALLTSFLGITEAAGYNSTIRHVYDNIKDLDSMLEFPSINLDDGDDICDNANPGSHFQFGGNEAILSNSFDLDLHCILHDTNDPESARDKMLADVQKHLGLHRDVPDQYGNVTAELCTYLGSTPWGTRRQMPNTGITIRFRIDYMQLMSNPKQSM